MADGVSPNGLFARILGNIRASSQLAEKTYLRLSSGLRINTASDDAAGLALATKLSSDSDAHAQGAKNADSTLDLLTLTSEATDALQAVVASLQEKAGEAQSSLLCSTQRASLQEEVDALTAEYNRIVTETEFNGQAVFSGYATISTNLGGGSSDTISVDFSTSASETVGTGSFSAATSLAFGGASTTNFSTTGDLNNDGYDDLLYSDGSSGYVNYRLSNGDGTFGARLSVNVGTTLNAGLSTGDFNGDGDLDIVVSKGSNGIAVALGNGNGTFGSFGTYASSTTVSRVRTGDLNGDGYEDVLVGQLAASVYVYFGSASGTLSTGVSIATTGTIAGNTQLADVDADGDLDILATTQSTLIDVYTNNGNGTFAARITSAVGLTSAVASGSGDFNGDGRLDVVVTDYTNGGLRVLTGNGNGTFAQATSYSTATGPFEPLVGDFNGDGDLDFVLGHYGSGIVNVYSNNGNGTFAVTSTVSIATPSVPSLGDFNNDSVIDVFYTSGTASAQVAFGATTTSTRTVSFGEIDDIDVSNIRSAIDAEIELESLTDDLTRLEGIVNGAVSRYQFASGLASSLSDIQGAASDSIRSIDAATELANHVRLQVLSVGQNEALKAASQLTLARVSALLQD